MPQVLARAASILMLFMASAVFAAPAQVDLVYEATRNGKPFATVTETYRAENGRYRIESVTKGVGVYALFGERRLTSEGEVTADGLKPTHFELHQGDNERKALYADFDWAANTLTMEVKGKPTTVPLQPGTQDLSSFMYQFMFAQPQGKEFVLPVTTGKKLNTYRYLVTERHAPVRTPAGSFSTTHLVNAEKDGDGKELWLGAEAHFLPVRLLMNDDHGAKIEQTLITVHVQ